mmetsp:Transcript_28680/g.71930  ORF Transcript_28680/g.71930 Transcript_28680/m.71930 type:complete len:282 (+) Transcript_28680:114-959(+)
MVARRQPFTRAPAASRAAISRCSTSAATSANCCFRAALPLSGSPSTRWPLRYFTLGVQQKVVCSKRSMQCCSVHSARVEASSISALPSSPLGERRQGTLPVTQTASSAARPSAPPSRSASFRSSSTTRCSLCGSVALASASSATATGDSACALGSCRDSGPSTKMRLSLRPASVLDSRLSKGVVYAGQARTRPARPAASLILSSAGSACGCAAPSSTAAAANASTGSSLARLACREASSSGMRPSVFRAPNPRRLVQMVASVAALSCRTAELQVPTRPSSA